MLWVCRQLYRIAMQTSSQRSPSMYLYRMSCREIGSKPSIISSISICAAARLGYIKSLVTDYDTAKYILTSDM